MTKQPADSAYLRIGTEYYKVVDKPYTFDRVRIIVRWKKQTILDDHGKYHLEGIPKYDGFCLIPDHTRFRQVIGNHYNRYEKLPCRPLKGTCDHILSFFRHIFGLQYELGLDYAALLYLRPAEKLPILCLVSQERKTGKSTFVRLLKLMFGNNMTLNSNEEFRSRFNADWAGKLIIAVEETLLDKREDSERIKNLSTGALTKVESKNVDKEEGEFFGKFILCSNNEDSFIRIDQEEIRYWVLKVPRISTEDTGLLDKMKTEIPAFLHFLKTRGALYEKKTRMWFDEKDLQTEALQKLKRGNLSSVDKELEAVITEKLLMFELNEVYYTVKDLIELLRQNGIRTNQYYVSRILQHDWQLKPVDKPSTYKVYYYSDNPGDMMDKILNYHTEKGRYYSFHRGMFNLSEV